MIKMIEFDEGVWVPEECCTMTNPLTSGGKSVPDDVEMPCEGSETCTGECSECIIQKIMNDYARCTGQTAGADTSLKGKRKNKLAEYPCEDYLHNALRFLANGNTDSAYTEICYAMMKAGAELREEEKRKFDQLIAQRYVE